MKQPISGVAPPELDEVTVMTVWPSIAATPVGRLLGRIFSVRFPDVYIFRLGHLFALMSIPVALACYFFRLSPSVLGMPIHGTFYQLTNRRVLVLRNEINLGDGSTTVRLLIFLVGAVPAALWWVICQAAFFSWAVWPNDTASWVVTVLCAAGVIVHLLPLILPVPIPHFTYGAVHKHVELDRFDSIDIEVLPGHEWFSAGDLVFKLEGTETFRLPAVSRPQAFRTTCLHSHRSSVGVKQAREREMAHA